MKGVFEFTPAIQGPVDITYGESETITSTFSISLSLSIKRKIAADLGAGYLYSVSTEKSFSETFPVPEGKIGRVQFVPLMRHTIGVYYYDSFTSYNIDAYIPCRMNSFADGLYRVVYVTM